MVEGNKRGFGDLDDDEEDIFSSKKVLFFLVLFETISNCCIKCSSTGHQTVLARSLLTVLISFAD